METIIRDALEEHLEQQELLSLEQHSFRKGKPCTTQLLEVIKDWMDILDINSK